MVTFRNIVLTFLTLALAGCVTPKQAHEVEYRLKLAECRVHNMSLRELMGLSLLSDQRAIEIAAGDEPEERPDIIECDDDLIEHDDDLIEHDDDLIEHDDCEGTVENDDDLIEHDDDLIEHDLDYAHAKEKRDLNRCRIDTNELVERQSSCRAAIRTCLESAADPNTCLADYKTCLSAL